MTKMSQKSRDDLVSMLHVERNALRCEIMKDLHSEAKVIKDKFVSTIANARNSIKCAEKEIETLKKERSLLLGKDKLLVFDEYDFGNSCSAYDLHPSLKEFDAETNRLKKEIIML